SGLMIRMPCTTLRVKPMTATAAATGSGWIRRWLSPVVALSLFTAAVAPACAGQFDGVTVRFATFGGKWRDIVEEHIGKAFEAQGGKIEYVIGQPAQNMANLIAVRGHPSLVDVMNS